MTKPTDENNKVSAIFEVIGLPEINICSNSHNKCGIKNSNIFMIHLHCKVENQMVNRLLAGICATSSLFISKKKSVQGVFDLQVEVNS